MLPDKGYGIIVLCMNIGRIIGGVFVPMGFKTFLKPGGTIFIVGMVQLIIWFLFTKVFVETKNRTKNEIWKLLGVKMLTAKKEVFVKEQRDKEKRRIKK
jgi:uncharacterized protein YacL